MKKILTGTVISAKMDKTIVVKVDRKLRHPLYKKVIHRSSKFKVHSENKNIKEGDVVTFQSCAPISKEKSFILVEKEVEKTK